MKRLLSLLMAGLLLLVPVQTASAATVNQTVGVFLINWLDDTSRSVTEQTVYNEMFVNSTSPTAYYQDTSYGQLGITGDVLGWYTVNYNKGTNCEDSLWATDARNQAIARGFDPAAYDIRIYMWKAAGCGYTGYASGNNIYINYLQSGIHEAIVTHEIGHTLGAGHAGTYQCVNKDGLQVSLGLNRGDSCDLWIYADRYDVMGNSSFHTMNAIHRTMLGWLPSENTQIVNTAGIYTILPLEWNIAGVQQIEVKQTGKGQNNPWVFCLEVRQSYGWDYFNENGISGNRWATNGVHIHYAPTCHSASPDRPGSTILLDATPNSGTEPSGSAPLNYPLPVGQTLSGIGVKIKTLSIGPNGATVEITYPKGNR